MEQEIHHPVWTEINLGAILHNYTTARQLAPSGVKAMAVIKANAYGHGDVQVAQMLEENGADYFGVARLNEAIRLRENGIRSPLLIFGYTPVESIDLLVKHGIAQTVYSLSYAKALSEKLESRDGSITIHLKIDTGMGRIGFHFGQESQDCINELCAEIEDIFELPGLNIEGIFTHLASSDATNKSAARNQLALFKKVNEELEQRDRNIPIKHAANSAAVLSLPESHLDMIRPGLMLYGCNPLESPEQASVQLQPAMQLRTRIAQIKEVPAEYCISYGHTYSTSKPTTIATLPLGYADGYDRRFSSSGKVLIQGKYAPVVGRVCMDQLMVDVGHIESVTVDDVVTIIGSQNGASIQADDIAEQLDTISYEVLSTVMHRVPRVYVK